MGNDDNQPLKRYRKKRDPSQTTEPFAPEPSISAPGGAGATRQGRYVVHCHAASRLHYDLRIQVGGVLQSFAVPRGPSLNIEDKRLAVNTEPHPLEYLRFEGVIPEGNYGAGAMIMWDEGRVTYPKQTAEEGLADGALSIELWGHKLRGRFSLVRIKDRKAANDNQWLLIKRPDAYEDPERNIIEDSPRSVLSGLTVQELADAAARREQIVTLAYSLGATEGEVRARTTPPMLCELQGAPTQDPQWLYELKLDGVRVLAEKQGDQARLFYRTHRAATSTFVEIAEAMRALPVDDVVLDGEIVAFDEAGKPSFHKLASRLHANRPNLARYARDATPVVYVVFDILGLEGRDLRELPLTLRQQVLASLVRGRGRMRLADHVEGDAQPLLAFCEAHELEGVVAKRKDAPYVSGRSDAWVKIKREREDDFLVFGYTEGKGARKRMGALSLCAWQGQELVACGRVGSGLDDDTIDLLLQRFGDSTCEQPAASGTLEPAPLGETFVEPTTVVRVRFGGWTPEHRLRFPVLVGVRNDLDPSDVVLRARPDDATLLVDASHAAPKPDGRTAGRVQLTNQSKVFWPDDGYTKGDLCAYYEAIAPTLLPHLAERPLVLVRYPNGIDGKSFHQWRIPEHAPPWLRSLTLRQDHAGGKKDTHTILVDDVDSLLYVANLGCIPLHIIASRAEALDVCDFLTIDLDVNQSTLQQAIPIAWTLREIVEEAGLTPYLKTSGRAGLHVIVPLGQGLPFDIAKQVLELIATIALSKHGDTATMQRMKKNRGEKVFIDVGQTGPSRTIVAPYSVRAQPSAPVSMPIHWDELGLSLDPREYTIFTVPRYLSSRPDPFAGAWDQTVDVQSVVAALGQMIQ